MPPALQAVLGHGQPPPVVNTVECRLRVILCRSLTRLERLLFLAEADTRSTSALCQERPFVSSRQGLLDQSEGMSRKW